MSWVYLDPETDIERAIERTRSQMTSLAGRLGFVHPEVIRCSEELDELLLQFYSEVKHGKRCS